MVTLDEADGNVKLKYDLYFFLGAGYFIKS